MSFLPLFSPERKIFKVHELTARIRSEVERGFSDIWVEGEVANLKIPSSGHLYFTLKDRTTQIKGIVFRSHGRFLKFIPKEGQSVLIRGHLTLYEAKGECQLIADYIEPRGAGALQAAFEALKERLRSEGLFASDRKKPIPLFPKKIALLTSPTGAALRDILKVILEKGLPFDLLIHPVPVQGDGAADEIAHAIDHLNRMTPGRADLLILARGGGSIEDLWAFNEEIVARAMVRSEIPIISAIGHESDSTIADFVADLRAPTPSVAAEIVVRNSLHLLERFDALQEGLHDRMARRIENERGRLRYHQRLLIAPRRQIAHLLNQVRHLDIRLQQALRRFLESRRGKLVRYHQGLDHLNPVERLGLLRKRFERAAADLSQRGGDLIVERRSRLQSRMVHLNMLSPLNILERGYSITQKALSREVVRNAADLLPGEKVQITLHRGKLICSVDRSEVLHPPTTEEKA